MLELNSNGNDNIRQPTISRSILNDEDLDIVVHAAVAEIYLHHISGMGRSRQTGYNTYLEGWDWLRH
jgi:hypothetical protein